MWLSCSCSSSQIYSPKKSRLFKPFNSLPFVNWPPHPPVSWAGLWAAPQMLRAGSQAELVPEVPLSCCCPPPPNFLLASFMPSLPSGLLKCPTPTILHLLSPFYFLHSTYDHQTLLICLSIKFDGNKFVNYLPLKEKSGETRDFVLLRIQGSRCIIFICGMNSSIC